MACGAGCHVVAALLGFGGAAIAIVGDRELSGTLAWGCIARSGGGVHLGHLLLMTKRVTAFPTTAIGLFGLVSGACRCCAMCCWAQRDTAARDWGLLAVLGLGPLGGAFYLWDKALKLGDARHIGILSYITPLASTALLIVVSGRSFS